MKIAYSFSQSVSNQFHVTILSWSMYFYKWLSLLKMEIWAILILRVIFGKPGKSTAMYRWIRTLSFKTIIFCFNSIYNTWKYVLYSY